MAEEITTRVHSAESCLAAKEVSGLLFNRNANKDQLYALSTESLTTVSEEITSFNIDKNIITSGIQIGDLISEIIPIVTSKGEARKAIKNNAIAVNKTKISSHEFMVTGDHLLHDKFIMIENGKKNKYMILATDK